MATLSAVERDSLGWCACGCYRDSHRADGCMFCPTCSLTREGVVEAAFEVILTARLALGC